MHVKNHFLLGLLISILLWFGARPETKELAAIMLSTVLIDLDHVAVYIMEGKKPRLRAYIDEQRYHLRMQKKRFLMLHKIEFPLLALLISAYVPIFLYISIGLTFHLMLDMIICARHHRSLRAMHSYSYLHDISCALRGVPAY